MDLPKRKPTRLKGYDYSQTGAYFITICTYKRKNILANIVGGDVLDAPNIELKMHGIVADKIINRMKYPNHFFFIHIKPLLNIVNLSIRDRHVTFY